MARIEEAAFRYEQALLHVRVLHGSLQSLASELLCVNADDVDDPTLRQRHLRLATTLAQVREAASDERQRIVREVEDLAARRRLRAVSSPRQEPGR